MLSYSQSASLPDHYPTILSDTRNCRLQLTMVVDKDATVGFVCRMFSPSVYMELKISSTFDIGLSAEFFFFFFGLFSSQLFVTREISGLHHSHSFDGSVCEVPGKVFNPSLSLPLSPPPPLSVFIFSSFALIISTSISLLVCGHR